MKITDFFKVKRDTTKLSTSNNELRNTIPSGRGSASSNSTMRSYRNDTFGADLNYEKRTNEFDGLWYQSDETVHEPVKTDTGTQINETYVKDTVYERVGRCIDDATARSQMSSVAHAIETILQKPRFGTYDNLGYGNTDGCHKRTFLEIRHQPYAWSFERRLEGQHCRFVREIESPASTSISFWNLGQKQRRNEFLPRTFEELLKFYPCCPPKSVMSTEEFTNNTHLNYLDDNCKTIRIALRNWTHIICKWSIREFFEYYNSSNVRPYWNAYESTLDRVYFSVQKSIRIAIELLETQFDDDNELIIEFLQTLYNVCDHKIPKLNSICVVSPPSAGKNYFFDAVAAYFINYGMYGTANKRNKFMWADGVDKRLILWNNPKYDQFHIKKIKELLGGDTTRVHVKYKSDKYLQRTPVIILTNNQLNICHHPEFRDRLRTYHWRAAPQLKNYALKLNPLFFYHILLHYNIDIE